MSRTDRRSFLAAIAGLLPAGATAAALKSPPGRARNAQEPRSAISPHVGAGLPLVKDWSRLEPGYDPDPLPIGTRCLMSVGIYPDGDLDGPGSSIEWREVTIAAGPINPEPGNWKNPIGWYAVDAPWIDESLVRMGGPWSPTAASRRYLKIL